jgi:putative ABC transport system substrate-binding protein
MQSGQFTRRGLIALLTGAAAPSLLWPPAARAQQRAMPVIGFLGASSLQSMAGRAILYFKRGLAETGYVEDRDVAIEYRFADDHYDRLPALAAELVQRRVDVIAAPGEPGARAAKAATSDIPVVFMTPSDPVEAGLVASINRPGGNLTGYAYLNQEVAPKRLGLLHEFIPAAKSIGFLVNPASPGPAAAQVKEMQAAAATLGLRVTVANASSALDLEEAFAIFARERVEAIQMGIDGLFGNHIDQIVALATRSKIPMIYPWREFSEAGGLMNYGASIPESIRQVGVYAGRILKGAKPADLPIQRPTKLQLVLNVQAAKAIGIEFPANLLAIADEVIE